METENIEARNAIESTIKSNRKIILELLSSISNFCGKEVDFDNIKATPPSFLFDKLKSAEQYDNHENSKYKNAAKKLREFLILKTKEILQHAILFLKLDGGEGDGGSHHASTHPSRAHQPIVVLRAVDGRRRGRAARGGGGRSACTEDI